MTLYLLTFLALCCLGVAWFVRKAGKDEERSDATEEALDDVVDANRPLSDPELQRVRERFKRD